MYILGCDYEKQLVSLGRKFAFFRYIERVERGVGAAETIPPTKGAKICFESLAVVMHGMHGTALVTDVFEYVLQMPRENVSRVRLRGAHFAEQKPSPKGEQMCALEEPADDGWRDEGEREAEHELYGVRFAACETIGVEKGVMFEMEVFEHELHVEQPMRPVKERVFEHVEEQELYQELLHARQVCY